MRTLRESSGSHPPCRTMFVTSSPASADVDVCAGTGTATLNQPLTYPGIGGPVTTGFSFGFTAGTCVFKAGLSATGTVSGWCGLSSGQGETNSGHRFVWQGVGGELVLVGEVNGVVNAIPDALQGESCITGADRFLVQGAVEKSHCVGGTKVKTNTSAGGWTVYGKVCVAASAG